MIKKIIVVNIIVLLSVFINTDIVGEIKYINTFKLNHSLIAAAEAKAKTVKLYDIPLTEEEQVHATKLAKKYGYDVKYIYGVIKQESGFNPKAVSFDGNDYGLMQWNKPSGTFEWLKQSVIKELGINENEFDWKNSIHNMTGGAWLLGYWKDYWTKRGYDKNKAMELSLLTYNMGINNAQEYLSEHQARDWKYVKNVLNNISNLQEKKNYLTTK